MDFGPRHRKRIWYTAAIGGLAGVTGLAAVIASVVSTNSQPDSPAASPQNAARPAVDDRSRPGKGRTSGSGTESGGAAKARASADRSSDRSGDHGATSGSGRNGTTYGSGKDRTAYDRGKDGTTYDSGRDAGAYHLTTDVPCDADALIAALVHANADGGGTLELAGHCTYTLTANVGEDGLPLITEPVTVLGNGATIVRTANAAPFRIFHVGLGGDLNLRDLTVKGGQVTAPAGPGGGGLLVDSGGQAQVVHSRFTRNLSASVGGAVANYGITRITDAPTGNWSEEKDWASNDWASNDWASKDASSRDGGTEEYRSSVDNNSAYGGQEAGGGGVFNGRYLTVDNTQLTYNNASGVANHGGAIATDLGGVSAVSHTLLGRNRATNGGAVYVGDGTGILEHSEVADNTSDVFGGGIYDDRNAFYLRSSRVHHNSAGSFGGGIFGNFDDVVVDESEVTENTTGGAGGGIHNNFGRFVVRRSDVSSNKAVGANSRAGGIDNNLGQLFLTDSRVAENLSTLAPGGVDTNLGSVDADSTITRNRPTNCAPDVVENCFG